MSEQIRSLWVIELVLNEKWGLEPSTPGFLTRKAAAKELGILRGSKWSSERPKMRIVKYIPEQNGRKS